MNFFSKIKSLISKGLINAVDDTTDIQTCKVSTLHNDVQDNVERLQPYGLTSHPDDDSEALVLSLDAQRDNAIIIVTDSGKHRVKGLKKGEVCVYSQHGQSITLKVDGSIDIIGAKQVNIDSSIISLGGNSLLPNSGVVTGESLCAFTGTPHADFSMKVRAKK
jgi:phage baseplate assembly protein V